MDIWYGTVDNNAGAIGHGLVEACTVCRARAAEHLLDRYREIPKPLSPNPFDCMVAFARAGIWVPRLYERGDAVDVLGGLALNQRDRQIPLYRVATTWKVRGGKLLKVTAGSPARLFRVGTTHLLAFDESRWTIAGPFTARSVANTTVPDANARDMVRRPLPPKAGSNPYADNAVYTLRWRPVVRGQNARNIDLDSFRSVVTPLFT